MIEAWIVATSFGCENAIVDVSFLEVEENLDCLVFRILGLERQRATCLV